MKRTLTFLTAVVVAIASCAGVTFAQNLDENGALPRATPESVGISSEAVAETIRQLDEKFNRVDGVMILRDGKVVGEAWRAPFGPDKPHALYSLSKSFCSTAVGFAVAEGKLSVDQKIVDFFPDELPENPDPRLKDVTIENLLTMSCGHSSDPWPSNLATATYGLAPILSDEKPTWAESFLARKIEYEPGTHFMYNTTGTYMCSAIVQKAVGQTVCEYLQPRLFDPLKIEAPYWEQSPQGISKGGTGLFLKTEDIAKFGQLYLQKGVWNGERLLPEEWIDAATSKHVSNGDNPNSDWAQGYGYQFWRCRHNVYRGDGMYSQFCVVMPDQNMVVAINSDCNDYQGELNVLFDVLLPAAQDAPLPENPDALAKLREVEKSLQPKEGASGSDVLELSLYSEALKREMKYRVYIPNEYRTTSTYYPVLYLLHGYGDDQSAWSASDHGDMKKICDEWFAAHPDQKRIVVMPDALKTWYRDSFDDSSKYETYFFNELIPHVQARFRIKDDKASRAVAGLSMGGYGTALYALRHPDYFSAAVPMSAALFAPRDVRGDGSNDQAVREYVEGNNPIALLSKLTDDQKKSIRFLLDCGDDDFLLQGNLAFFAEARKLGVPCELRVRNGGHEWGYWRVSLPMALEFIAK